jgi:hypothetical protein
MVSRLLVVLTLTITLAFGFAGVAKPQSVGPTTVSPTAVRRSAPEFNPLAIRGGVVMLAAGLLIFSEHRRKKQ